MTYYRILTIRSADYFTVAQLKTMPKMTVQKTMLHENIRYNIRNIFMFIH